MFPSCKKKPYRVNVIWQHLTNQCFKSTSPQEAQKEMQGETIGSVSNAHAAATLRLLYDAKWETNCRVAGRNGSWSRLSLTYSARWAPLITAACHRHAPLLQRADNHAPDLRAATGWPHITHTCRHTQAALFTRMQLDVKQITSEM